PARAHRLTAVRGRPRAGPSCFSAYPRCRSGGWAGAGCRGPPPGLIFRVMATLTINGRPRSADPEQTSLEAARAAGIVDIPTRCWYPKLPIVRNCRICLVSVEGQAKLLPACATQVADGMVVQTESHAAVENRKGVLRLLLERYPTDYLRNGGRAQPRNEFEQYVVRYGVAPTAMGERDLPLRHGDERPGDAMIRHDMSTCILCTRCVRACEDIQVVGVLDVAQRGEHVEIIVGADGDPDKAGCTWCGASARVRHSGGSFEGVRRRAFAGGRGGSAGGGRRGGRWETRQREGRSAKPAGPPRSVGKSLRELPLLERLDMDIRDRVATPPSWYEPFREATWEEALELVSQELSRIKG